MSDPERLSAILPRVVAPDLVQYRCGECGFTCKRKPAARHGAPGCPQCFEQRRRVVRMQPETEQREVAA